MFDLTKVNWNRLYYFYLVGLHKNITVAARYANIDQSGMSRHMISLEREVGEELLLRSRDGITFTEMGEEVYSMTGQMVHLTYQRNKRIDEIKNDMSGTLTILTTQGIIRKYANHLPHFYEMFPNIRLNFDVSRSMIENMAVEKYDIAILPKFSEHNEFHYVPIKKLKLGIFASRGYLEKHGTPKKPEDLDHHGLIAFSPENLTSLGFRDFHLTLGRKDKKMREPSLQIGAADSLIFACQKDMGIITYIDGPEFKLPKNIVKILDKSHSETLDFHFIFSKKLKNSRKVIEFINFFEKRW